MRSEVEMLKAGVTILDELLRSHGFVFTSTSAGLGSGGSFASGEYRRGNRGLKLHFRHVLGLVTYHVGSLTLSHYPGFSREPLDGFQQLLADLRQCGSDFLVGPDENFEEDIQCVHTLKKATLRLPS